MSQKLYAFNADIEGRLAGHSEVWYVEAHGDTEDQAKEEALWLFKAASGRPITEIKNIRLSLPDQTQVYGNDCPLSGCE